MRGLKTVAVALSLLMLLSGCGRLKRAEYTLDAPPTPKVDSVTTDSVESSGVPESLDIKPVSPEQDTPQSTAAQTPAQVDGTAAPAVNSSEARASDATVDALIQELDELGKMLDSLDNPSDADLVYPES